MIHPPAVIVETDRLVVRLFHFSDADAMNRIFGDPEVMRFGDGVQTSEWVRNWICCCLENYRQKSGIGPWAVIKKSSETVA